MCGVLNSSEIEEIIQGYTINTNRGIDIVNNIKIPTFNVDNEDHKRIAELSIKAHQAYIDRNPSLISEYEKEINKLVKSVFVE